MANDEKKVIFTAQDNVSQKVNQISQGIIANAQKYSASLKEQVSYINQQIKALETKAKIEKQSGESALKELEKQTKTAAPGLVKQQMTSALLSERAIRASKEKENVEAITLLKELVSESKKHTTVAEKAEKEAQKEEQRKAKYIDRLSAREEAFADPKGIKKKFATAESTRFEGMSASEIERLQYQNAIVSKHGEKTDSHTFKEVFLGMLAAGAVEKLAHGLHTAVGAPGGEEAFNSLVGAIPGLGFLGEGMNKAFEQQAGVGIGLNRLRAMSGRDVSPGGNTGLGYSSLESIGLQGGLLGAAGSASNLAKNTSSAQTLEKGLGLSQATLVQIVRDARTIRSTADMTQLVSSVIKANPELKGDQTKLGEILQMHSSMINTIAAQTENVNASQVTGIMGALRGVGGNFADPTLGMKNMMNINQALTNPSNDFQKARSFSALNALQPGSSYFQLLEAKEKGIGQQGYLSAMLSQLKRETGGGENFALATMKNLGLGASTSRKLTEAFEKNPEMFTSFKGGTEDITNMLGGRAEKLTHEKDIEKARKDEAFLTGTAAGIFESGAQVIHVAAEKFHHAVENVGEKLGISKEGTTAALAATSISQLAVLQALFGGNGKKHE